MTPHYAWQLALERLEQELPPSCFDRCVRNARVIFYHDGLFWVGAPDDLARTWLEHCLTHKVREILASFMNRPVRVNFIVEKPETDLSRSSKWHDLIPLSEELVEKHGLAVAAVGGRIWAYGQMGDRLGRSTISNLARELNLSRRATLLAIRILVAAGYVMDLTPILQNGPHHYVATDRIDRLIRTTGRMAFVAPQKVENGGGLPKANHSGPSRFEAHVKQEALHHERPL